MTDQASQVIRLNDHLKPQFSRRCRAERIKLTERRVAAIKATPKRQRIADADVVGLHLVVTPTGSKSYVVRGRVGNGRSRPVIDFTIGPTGTVSLAEARKRAKAALAQMQLGEDPRQRNGDAISVGDVVGQYLDHHHVRGTVTADKIGRCLGRATRGITQTPMTAVSRRQWADRIAASHRQNGLAPATDDAKWLRAMAKWAIANGLIEATPALTIAAPIPSTLEKVSSAERREAQWTLCRSEWLAFWAATVASPDPIFTAYMRLLAITGLRRREASLAHWTNIDLDEGTWIIPPGNAKAARKHVVYLGPLAQRLLGELPRDGDLVFPGRGGVPMSGWSKRIRPVSAAFGRPVQLHGLRRGFRTALADLRVDTDVAELAIAHARPGLEARYNRSELELERRAAQDLLEQAWLAVVS